MMQVKTVIPNPTMAKQLMKEQLLRKVMKLMFLNDPPLQCEAASVALQIMQHKDLREV